MSSVHLLLAIRSSIRAPSSNCGIPTVPPCDPDPTRTEITSIHPIYLSHHHSSVCYHQRLRRRLFSARTYAPRHATKLPVRPLLVDSISIPTPRLFQPQLSNVFAVIGQLGGGRNKNDTLFPCAKTKKQKKQNYLASEHPNENAWPCIHLFTLRRPHHILSSLLRLLRLRIAGGTGRESRWRK